MYCALAELSPEMQTFDDILDRGCPSSPSTHTLPTEIMLLVREELQLSLIAQAVDLSARALDAYDASVRHSLCGDCLTYNQDVFGDDIWRWQWSGPCACRADRRRRNAHRETRSFRTVGEWREHHSSSCIPTSSIRAAMSFILERHGCQSPALNASSVGALPEMVVITASPPAVERCQTWLGEDAAWCSEVIVQKARRELGLSVAEDLDVAMQKKNGGHGGPAAKEHPRHHCTTVLSHSALGAVASGCAAVLTLPVLSVAFVVLVACHYVRPFGIRAA